jgi:hypothetical protein
VDEWAPALAEPQPAYKWGWNRASGEAAVWPVAGPADGLPTHDEYLRLAWGREPDLSGDVLGIAYHRVVVADTGEASDERKSLVLEAYLGKSVPSAVVAAFRRELPDVVIETV